MFSTIKVSLLKGKKKMFIYLFSLLASYIYFAAELPARKSCLPPGSELLLHAGDLRFSLLVNPRRYKVVQWEEGCSGGGPAMIYLFIFRCLDGTGGRRHVSRSATASQPSFLQHAFLCFILLFLFCKNVFKSEFP